MGIFRKKKKVHASEVGLLLIRDLLTWTLCTKEAEAVFLKEIYPMDRSPEQQKMVLWELWCLMLFLIYLSTPSKVESQELRTSVMNSLNKEMDHFISHMDDSSIALVHGRLNCYLEVLKQNDSWETIAKLFRHYVDGIVVMREIDDPNLDNHLALCPELDDIVTWFPSIHLQVQVIAMIDEIVATIDRFFKGLKICR